MTNKYPLVSIIIPTYNRRQLLRRALTSALSQSYTNIEVIVIDDGSQDGTNEVITQINDPRVRYLWRQENRGIGFSRAEGIDNSIGEIIALLDSDDEWMDGKLKAQVELLVNHPEIDVLFGNFFNSNQKEGILHDGFEQTSKGFQDIGLYQIDKDCWVINKGFPEAMLQANFIATSSVVMRAEVIKSIGNFCQSLSGPEDFEFWWRAGVNRKVFGFTNQKKTIRFKNETSISGFSKLFLIRYLQALEYCETTAKQNNRRDLIKLIQRSRHTTWRGLIKEYALVGDRTNAWIAFKKSLAYGVSVRAFFLLVAAVVGPDFIRSVKKTKFLL